jgi:E3 ubiquitin-protein ligase mind-bomb
VHRVTDKGDIRVQYDSGIRWTFNPIAVTKIITYSVGDLVQVIPDCNKVKEFQKGHGEWVDVMKEIVGKTGCIVKVYGDNDLRINFTSSVWTMNPLAVKLVRTERSPEVLETNNSMYANAHRREESSQDPMSSMLPLLDDLSAEPTTVSIERFVRDAAQGRVDSIKKTIPKVKDRVRRKVLFCSVYFLRNCSKMIINIILRYHPESLLMINCINENKIFIHLIIEKYCLFRLALL